MTEVYQNPNYSEQVRETIVQTLMLERACDEMKDDSLEAGRRVRNRGAAVASSHYD